MKDNKCQYTKLLISIIVPIFQVEKYLEKCISSIIAQSYPNLEIILVDDGSYDKCPLICDKFKAEDSRIKVIHKEHGGLSQTRNIGLKHAEGDFIGFVDSDDWIEPNMYETLMNVLQETGADIAICNHLEEPNVSRIIPREVGLPEIRLYSNEDALRMLLKRAGIKNTVWDKLYRRRILLDIDFSEGKIYEDILWTPMVLGNAQKIAIINRPLYHYLIRPESLAHDHKLTSKRVTDKIEMCKQRLLYIRKHYPSLEKLAISAFQLSCCEEYIRISLNDQQFDANGKIHNELQRQFCQTGSVNILVDENIKGKFVRILFWINPALCVKMFSIWLRLKRVKMKLQGIKM